ncbi:MAG: CBS domain-containing protein [Chloroflexi bacterium]|nr:CBS domain-containing protein [Chloroflexota bacterium]
MAYLSELLGRDVRDVKGALIGKLKDVLIAPEGNGHPYPRIVALAVKRGSNEPTLIPWGGTEDLAGNKIILQRPPSTSYPPAGTEIYLDRDVMDKQVIDTHGFRVVRVNDLELAKIGDDYRLVNVDIGGRGLLRRLGWEDIVENFAALFHREIAAHSIAFTDLEFIPRGDLKVRVARHKLKELHPADIAEIIEDMRPREAGALIGQLSDEQAADVMEELEPEFQADVLETLPSEQAADIVEEMEPDEAADALQEMEEDKRAQVFNLMEPEESAEVAELLKHPEDTAGGLMTPKYLTVPSHITIAEALQRVRVEAPAKEAETIYYVYAVDAEEHLLGVFSLSDLVLASPEATVDSIMHHKPIRVQVDASHEDVLESIAKYNLLAVPVVDAENHLLGIVTAGDALDLILPEEWKIKMPRAF